MCCSRSFFFVIFRALSWGFSWRDFKADFLRICWGMYARILRGSFPFDSPPKSVRKGAPFWGFRWLRICVVLGGNSSILLDSTSFGGP
jgi:hypothetical protein